MTDTPHSTPVLPLAVWPCAQHDDQQQPPASFTAEIARRAIETYSDRGGLVLDPLCSDPATLVEVVRLGRDALGVTGLDPERNADAVLAVRDAQRAGAQGEARLLVGEPRELLRLFARQAGEFLNRRANGDAVRTVARHPCGAVDLILLSLPATALLEQQRRPRRRWRPRLNLADLISTSSRLLRPGGFLVATSTTARTDGTLRAAGAETVQLCQAHGLQYWQHVIALGVPIRDGQLQPPRHRQRGKSGIEPCHADVLVLRKPATRSSSGKLKRPQREPKCSVDAVSAPDTSVRAEPERPSA